MTQGSYNINWDLICIANCVILQHYLDLQKTGFKVFLNWLSETIWQHPHAFSAYLGIWLEYFIRSKHIHLPYTFTCIDIGNESKVPCGVIEVMMELFPKSTKNFGQDVVAAQISLEKSRQAERERLFLVYAKQWWKEYLQIRPAHQDRLVKIFAQVKWSDTVRCFFQCEDSILWLLHDLNCTYCSYFSEPYYVPVTINISHVKDANISVLI